MTVQVATPRHSVLLKLVDSEFGDLEVTKAKLVEIRDVYRKQLRNPANAEVRGRNDLASEWRGRKRQFGDTNKHRTPTGSSKHNTDKASSEVEPNSCCPEHRSRGGEHKVDAVLGVSGRRGEFGKIPVAARVSHFSNRRRPRHVGLPTREKKELSL